MRAKQGRVVRKGEHQRSTVLSGMQKKARLLDSDLINTRRIMQYSGQSSGMRLIVVGKDQQHKNKFSSMMTCCPCTSKPLISHKANSCSFCKLQQYPGGLFSTISLTACMAAGDRFKWDLHLKPAGTRTQFVQRGWHEDCNRKGVGGLEWGGGV